MITIGDAVTNLMMREIAALAEGQPRPATMNPANRTMLDEGFVMVEGQIAPVSEAASRRRRLAKRPPEHSGPEWDDTLMEHEDNEFFMWTETPLSDPTWRVEILNQGMEIVRELAPQLSAIAPLPVQVVLGINSGLGHGPDDEDDVACGVVKFFLLRPGRDMDQRRGVERSPIPGAIFTFIPTGGS